MLLFAEVSVAADVPLELTRAEPEEEFNEVASSIETKVTESRCLTKGPKLSCDTVRFQVPTHDCRGFLFAADIENLGLQLRPFF